MISLIFTILSFCATNAIDWTFPISKFIQAERKSNRVSKNHRFLSYSDVDAPLGGCVIATADSSAVPDDLWNNTGIIEDSCTYRPFSKYIQSRGITFVASDNIVDSFILSVVETLEELIPDDPNNSRRAEQEELITFMASRRAVLPIFRREAEFNLLTGRPCFDILLDENSICNSMYQLSYGEKDEQPLEVLTNLLHVINLSGLHFQDYNNWGITNSSTLYNEMSEAINKTYYDVEDYEDVDDDDTRIRIELQKYASWTITSWMDVLETYGGVTSDWNLTNPQLLNAGQPTIYGLCNNLADLLAVPVNLDEYL